MTIQLDQVYVTNVYQGKNGAAYLEATDGGQNKIKFGVQNYNAADWPVFTPLKVVARLASRLFGRDLSLTLEQYQVEVLPRE